MRRLLLLAATLVATSSAANAQSSQPYAGLEQRPIKALSQQQIDDLKAGRGMGLALAAELNGYPGPSHILELGDRLDLTPDQRIQVQHLFDAMKQEAVPLGNKLVEQERELDHLFSARIVTSESLKAALVAISETQALLRESHLKYHLSTSALLDQSQMQRYAELRGYQRADGAERHRHHH
ncbi:periplasmic heavy metal sensor [Bradyrhizobium sp. CB1717]|uniref:periplasmic heavy metal sensor n=1 Tax=Bradyrhizobium sp. CB1717 TaxID=3039154 RepID=UPI0024B25363|nr:periplasmic heavy metal sensor [Bradyrhizobium sp. CB1717]WFU27876.1 periplasmic heavy metal sensor [Bradyrhizobium sp. CB1717]